ncbi:gp16 [Catopsilia pomona nucleopolyhedrovirus]|uniref:Gp16 n=1 Tax=Catopsilia pomona nucleopolyhedrovirus TaxID=1850906 RepID=A0A172WZA0_9ABAC|nr:gp16 [Catopsilia pomona nucleopolyhedrovirus]ANF29672.1 gp16 [Catopsilia pomona nucleopolyhedrovirus]
MNVWATFSIVLIGYLVYFGHLNNELQEIKSILMLVYNAIDENFANVLQEIVHLKTDTLTMLDNLQNTTVRTWNVVVENGKKITSLDEKINVLLVKNGVDYNNVLYNV